MDKKARNTKPGLFSLQTKLAIAFAVLAVVSSGIVTAAIYLQVRSRAYQDISSRLNDAVSIGALHVDGDVHSLLKDPSQEEGSVYINLAKTFQNIRDAGIDFRNVYSMRSIDGKVFFVVNGKQNAENATHLGDEYTDAPPGLSEAIATANGPFVYMEPYTDQWGTWLSGFAPIYKTNGTLDAVLGIDIAASDVIAYQNSILTSVLLIFSATTLVMGTVGWFLGRQLAAPILTLIEGAQRIEEGDLNYKVQVKTRDETMILADAFNSMSAKLRDLVSDLERRVAERTHDVEQRSMYLSTAAEVSRVAATFHEPDELIHSVVDLIRDSFNLYYVGLFLLDEDKEYAVLRAGSGEAGRVLVERGHRIRRGEGMIGWCVEHAQARVVLEAGQDAVRKASPLLPNTRSEAALPLRIRGEVAGALTVQSEEADVFDETALTVLQAMVDQVGIALENARLFAENEQTLKILRRSVSDLNRQAWEEALQKRSILGYHGDASGIQPIQESDTGLGKPVESGEQSEHTEVPCVQIPLKVRDQVLGYVEAHKPQAGVGWSKDEIGLLNTLVDQLGVALENARLFEESQRKAEHERILADITGRVRSSTDINYILQTAVQELAEALRVPRGAIRLLRSDAHSREVREQIMPASRVSGNGGSSNE